MASLVEQLLKEITRVKEELIPAYRKIGPQGIFAIDYMCEACERATQAAASGDAAQMIKSLVELQGFRE